MIICILAIALCVGLLGAGLIMRAKDKCNGWEIPTGLSVAILVSFITIIAAGEMIPNYSEKVELQNFYTTNVRNYADTVNMSEDILSQAKFVEGLGAIGEGLAYSGQSVATTEAIVEWRDAINDYNSRLAQYKAWQSNPWTNWFHYDIDAEFLTIK